MKGGELLTLQMICVFDPWSHGIMILGKLNTISIFLSYHTSHIKQAGLVALALI